MYFVIMNGKPISKHKTEEAANKKISSYIKKANTFRLHERRSSKACLVNSHGYTVRFINKTSPEFPHYESLVKTYLETHK